jgi:hypothetical protein
MNSRPKTPKGLQGHGEECEAIHEFLLKYWEGLEGVQPKDFEEFLKDYCDYDGMEEWDEFCRKRQEDDFKGFDDSGAGSFNLVATLSLPHIAYDHTNQGRNPLRMLISAIMGYGFSRGEIYATERCRKKAYRDLALKLLAEEI